MIVVPVGRDISDMMRGGIWRVEMVPNFEDFRRMREAIHGFIERENCPLRELIANDPGTPEGRRRLNFKEKKNHCCDNWNVVQKVMATLSKTEKILILFISRLVFVGV